MFATGGILTPLLANRLLDSGLYWGALYWIWAVYTVVIMIGTLIVKFPPAFVRQPETDGFTKKPKLIRDGLLLCATLFFSYSVWMVCTAWLPSLASDRLAYDSTQAVLVLSLFNIGCIVGTVIFLLLLRKFPGRIFLVINPAIALIGLVLCV